jgi:hypothetical protein
MAELTMTNPTANGAPASSVFQCGCGIEDADAGDEQR